MENTCKQCQCSDCVNTKCPVHCYCSIPCEAPVTLCMKQEAKQVDPATIKSR